MRNRECLWFRADSLLLLSLCSEYIQPLGFECQQSVFVSNSLFFSFLSLIEYDISKLQPAVCSNSPAQPGAGLPRIKRLREANKLLQHGTTNAVRSHTLSICTQAHTAVPQLMSGMPANSRGVPYGFSRQPKLSGSFFGMHLFFWHAEATLGQMRVPNNVPFIPYNQV